MVCEENAGIVLHQVWNLGADTDPAAFICGALIVVAVVVPCVYISFTVRIAISRLFLKVLQQAVFGEIMICMSRRPSCHPQSLAQSASL